MSWLDRGNKLWVGHRIILPEHEALLHEQERKQKVFQPPELDEDYLEEMEYIMQRALYEDMAVIATYATTYGPEEYCGFITRVNPHEKWLEIANGDDRKIIRFKDLLKLEEAREDE